MRSFESVCVICSKQCTYHKIPSLIKVSINNIMFNAYSFAKQKKMAVVVWIFVNIQYLLRNYKLTHRNCCHQLRIRVLHVTYKGYDILTYSDQ